MSAIAFPHSYPAHSPSFAEDEDGTASYAMPGSASGFQMNPLSIHPPRTLHASMLDGPAPIPSRARASSSRGELVPSAVEYWEIARSVPADHPSPGNVSAETEEDVGHEHEQDGAPSVPEVEVASGAGNAKASQVRAHTTRVRREDVWREIIKSSNGRDKALKLIQYTLKVYLLFHTALAKRAPLSARRAWQTELLARLTATTGGLSLARKCLLLFNWLTPLTAVLAQNTASVDPSAEAKSALTTTAGTSTSTSTTATTQLMHTVLHAPPPVLLELLNGAADDAATWARLGLLGARTGDRAARIANWCWFASTLVGLVENGVERGVIVGSRRAVENRLISDSLSGQTAKSQPRKTRIDEGELQKLETQEYWLQVHRAKLIMDLVFVSYDVFRVKRGKTAIQAFTGLASALLSSSKLYDRSQNALLKSLPY